MELKLTNEEKAKVFAMYRMEQVQGEYMDEKCIGNLTGHTGMNELAEIQWILNGAGEETPDYQEYRDLKLLLTPLSSITDEHALEIAKIHGMAMAAIVSRDDYAVYMVDDTHSVELYFNGMIIYKKNGVLGLNQLQQICAVQRFSSWGYAYPLDFGHEHWANGKTAIELGIAIDKTEIS